MATEADIPDPISLLKREVEDKEMTSEVPNITVSEGPKEEKKKIESWLSQPPEITDFFGKTETEEVGSDDEVENTNVINKGSVETVESDVFSKSLSAADEKSVRDTEHSQMTSDGEKSKTLANSESMEKDAETIRPTIDMADEKNKHVSSLLDAPVEETSQETEELTEEMKDSTSVEDELPHNNPGPSFFNKMKGFFFHKVDNLQTSEEIETEGSSKEAETITNIEEQRPVGSPEEIVGEKQKDEAIIADDINKNEVQEANNLPTVDLDEKTRGAELEIPNKSGSEKQNEVSMSESGDHQEAIQFPKKKEKHVNETFEATENPESTISEHAATEGELNIEETLTSELKSEETLREINAEDKKEEEREQIEKASDTEFFVERKSDNDGRSTIEETKDSTSVEDELPHKNPEPSFFKKMGEFFFHKVDNLETSEEIGTEGSSKDAEMITNIEEQRPVGSPGEIVGEKQKDEAIIADDINKNEVQEANNLPTVELDEKTRSAELEIPNNSGSELGITHPPEEEEVQADRENQNEVSLSESGDPQEAIRCPDKEEKHFNETAEATESPESTSSKEGELNMEETSKSEMDINAEKGCELKSEETLKEINAEQNTEEVREQLEKASDTEFLSERKSDDDGRSTIEEDIPVKKGSPLCSEEEEYRQDQGEQVRSSNSVPEELSGAVSGDQSYMTSDEINTIAEQIKHQEVCEDPKMADRAEDIKKEKENEENTITDFSPEPLGESTTKKHEAEASKGYDTCGEIMTLEESAITDLPSSDVREDKVEESLKEDRREAMIPDKELWDSNIESRERDSEATHSTSESTTKDLKDEAEANEGLNAQSTIGSSSEETAQESDSNLVQSSSMPEIIEKEVNKELLEKQDSKDAVEATRLTAQSEYPMAADSPNLTSEEKGHVTTETSEMRSNDNDIIAEPAEISTLVDNEDMEIPTARKDGADESTDKTQPEDRNEICDELSKPEDQREISTVEASSEYKPEQEHLESSIMPLEAHNLVTGVSETTGEFLEKEKTLSDKEETPLVAETTAEYIAETEGDSTIQEIDTNIGSIDIGKERSIDNALVREPHPPLELDYGKSISESDVELLKGVNTREAANGSNTNELETSNNEKSSHVGVETDKSEFEEAVNEASQGVEVGGGCIETKNDILEQESPANNYEGSSKEGVEIEKATVEFESEAYDCGSVATEAQRISTQTEKKIDVEDRELSSELPNVTVNEVPLQEKENTESSLSQPPESIEIRATEGMQVAHNDEVGNVNVIDNVGTTEGESFLKSTSVADGELNGNTEDDQLNNKEEMIGFQEEEAKGEMITDKNFIAEASYGQDEGVRIQTPELTGGSSRDVEVLNEVLREGNMEKITSTEATSVEQDLKETSFEEEDKKSNALEMDLEATQPSTDIGEEKSKGEEMLTATENELDEPTESNVGATDELGSLLVTKPDVCKNLEEDSSMACEDDIQETGESVERMKEDASNEDEVEKQNLESSFVKRAENVETSKEESETGMKDIDQETQKEAENQNKTLENEEEGPVGSSEEIIGETIIATDVKEDGTREAKNLSMDDVGEKTRSAESNIPNNDANEVYVTPRPVEEPEEDEKIHNEVSTAKENLESPSIVALQEHETTPHDEHAESITKIEEERLVGKPEEIIGEQRSDEIMIADDSNNEEIPEAESLSAVDSDEKSRSAETEIPDNNTREVCVTHPTVEETVLEGGEKKNEVSLSESVDQVHEASASEFPEDEEKHANDSYEASKSPDCNVSGHTCTEGELDTEATTSAKEILAGRQEEIIWQPRKEESMIKIPEAENSLAVESYVTPPSKEETFLDKNDVSMLDQVHEASEVPREEEKENESKDTYEATESPESNILEDTATEGAVNVEATSTRSAEDITLDKGGEPISEDEPKEPKTEDNLEEEIEQKEKAADAEFQMPTISDDKENSTIKRESLVENNTPTCTREGEYHDQEDEGMSNRSIEASPALDSREQSCSTSNETTIIDDQIMNEETIQVHQDPKIADAGEDTDDLMKNAAHTVVDLSPELTGEHATMCPQENETEVLEKLPTAEGSANMGIQMKEEHSTTKDSFDESYGEETRNECSYGEEKEEKEPDTVVPTVTESASESEIIKEQTTEEESCTKELHEITAADQTVRETDLTAIHSLEAMASDKNAESNIAEDLNIESVSPQKELNETEDEFSTGKVSTETSLAMDEVTYPDQTAIHSLEATTEMMESKTAEDLNEESEASPMAEVLEDELKNMEKPVDVSSLVSEGSDEKMKGEKIEEMEICGEETDIAPTVVPDLSSLGEVRLNDEPLNALDASSDAESLQATKTAEAGEKELEETSIIESDQFPIHEHENADNANRYVEKSDANEVEIEATEIPDSVSLSEDQAVKEIHRTGSSPSVIEPDTKEIEKRIREVPEVSLESTDAARDDEITPGQTPQPEKTEEQLQVPSYGLLSEEQESETTTRIAKGSTNKDATEEGNISQSEVSMVREELETTSDGDGIENRVQGEENRVQDLSTVSRTEELDAESSKDNSIITKMSAQEVLETNHGSQDTNEPVKALFTSSDTGSLQELDETSSVVSQFPVDECGKSENVRANVDKSDTYDVEEKEKELEIPAAVPEHTDQRVHEIQETGTSLPVGEAHTTETAYQTRDVPEAFSQAIKQGVEPVSGDEIIAPAVAAEVRSLDELQLNEHMKALDTPSSAENLEAIKTADASQQDAEFEDMKLEETMVSQPPIHVHEEEDRENIPLEKSEANDVQVEETKIPDTVPESEDQAGKEILETGTGRNVGDTDTNELEKPISKVPEALSEEKNQGVDAAGHDEITPRQILQSEKPEEQLDAPSSGLISKEQESETTTIDEKGSTDRDDIEGTKALQAKIGEELETTGEGKGIGNQVQAEEERAQDWSTVSSAKEFDTKSSIDNAMITKMSTEEVLETDHGGHDTDEHVKALDTSSDIERLQTTQTPDASQQELEETSSMVSQLPVHVYEKAYNESVTEENSDACDVEVKEIDFPGVVSESNDQRVKEIHEVGASVEETRTKEMETQIREVCEALPEDVNQGGEPVGRDEIVSSSEAIEVTSLGELQLNDEQVEAPETNKTGDASQQDAEFDSIKHEETSILVSQLPIHEYEKEESANIPVEKSDANDVDVEEAEIPDTMAQSEDQAVKEIHETGTSLTEGGADTNETENHISGVPEALSEPINPCFETSRDDEMTPVQTLRTEKIEEELQVPSSPLLSKEEDGETSIEKGITDKDGTEVGSLELQDNSGSVLQLPVTAFNSPNDVTEEKSNANEVEPNETKALDVVSDSKDGVFEAIQEIRTIPAAEDTETDKVEDEIKEVTEKIPDLRYKGVDAATDGENLDHPLPVDKLDEQIQLSSSSYESAKEEAAELDDSELEKATDMSSKLPTTEHGIHHVGTTIENSEEDEVLVEEAKTSEGISESKGDVFEEFKEIGSRPPVEEIRTDEVQEETKAVPETILEPTYQGAQTAIDQTLTSQGVEQLQEPESTTEKLCLQDERQRELEVSNLELTLQDSQDISQDEENTGLEKGSTDAPLHYEERPVQQSSQEAAIDEDIVFSKNSNKDADNLPTPYPTVAERSTEDIGRKNEEVSNLEFEKNEEVLLEPVSAINNPAVPLTSEGIELKEETPKESTTEEEAIEKYISAEKISEEMQGSRNFDQLSLQEETATKTNQEDKLRAEDYPGERTSTIFDASRNEIQHEVMFKESEEDCVDKNMEGVARADDKGPHQVSAPDEIANQSELGSHGDETDFTDTATEKTAQMEELKSSEAMLVCHEVERTGNDDEETVISKDGQLQNTDLVVPAVPDMVAEEALDGKELETFDDLSERALDPTHGIMEPYEHKKEIATAGTINSESLVDNEKLGHTFPKPGSEGSVGTENLDLTKKDGSQETLADEESEKAVDTKQLHFKSNEPTAKPESIPEEGNGFQLESHTMDKEPVEFSVMADEGKLDENKIPAIATIEEEESPQENDKPNVLPDIMDSEMELSREAVAMNISEDIQGLEKTSLAIPHEQIASKTDPSESIERTNSKGMECGEEKRMGKQSEEITAQSEMTESAKMSLSDVLQRSTKRSMQGVEDVTEERELKQNKEEQQNEKAETVVAEEEAVHDKKDEEEEGDELKREDSGSDAPVMVEASRDMDDKIAHKKAHHHNILSGVGSKVKHSLAKVKKAITGKSSHPKPTSPK